jgi:hypothetical protein
LLLVKGNGGTGEIDSSTREVPLPAIVLGR